MLPSGDCHTLPSIGGGANINITAYRDWVIFPWIPRLVSQGNFCSFVYTFIDAPVGLGSSTHGQIGFDVVGASYSSFFRERGTYRIANCMVQRFGESGHSIGLGAFGRRILFIVAFADSICNHVGNKKGQKAKRLLGFLWHLGLADMV